LRKIITGLCQTIISTNGRAQKRYKQLKNQGHTSVDGRKKTNPSPSKNKNQSKPQDQPVNKKEVA